MIWCDEPLGVNAVWEEIESYFHGEERVRAGEVVFDVGANIGLFSLAAHLQSEGGAHIWSFEPVPSTCHVLETNARAFDPRQTHWRTLRLGLGEKDEIAVLHHFPRVSVLSGRFRDAAQAKGELNEILAGDRIGAPFEFANVLPRALRRIVGRVVGAYLLRTQPVATQFWSLSSALSKLHVERIDWLKIDVEGAELDVLRGVNQSDWPRIKRVICEMESPAMLAQASELLQRAGFSVETRDNTVIQGQHLKLLFARRDSATEQNKESTV